MKLKSEARKNKSLEFRTVKKIINTAETLVADGLKGFCAAYPGIIEVHDRPLYVVRAQKPKHEKLALLSGGGSGHEPLHIGMVGFGMLDAACPGQLFTSPTPQQIVAAATAVDRGKGVLLLVKNYSGDRMNFEMAAEDLGMEHATVIISDETVPGAPVPEEQRRGLSGIVIFEKILGAYAETGADLPACLKLSQSLQAAVRSMGVTLKSCTLPQNSSGRRSIAEDEMEIGIGIHGEPGRICRERADADAIAEMLVTAISLDLALSPGDEILLYVNGMGGTPPMELYLLFGSAMKACRKKGLTVSRSLVGSHVTCLDMAGCIITICRLNPQLTSLWDYPVLTSSLCWGR